MNISERAKELMKRPPFVEFDIKGLGKGRVQRLNGQDVVGIKSDDVSHAMFLMAVQDPEGNPIFPVETRRADIPWDLYQVLHAEYIKVNGTDLEAAEKK